jgi:hypothetical protein
MCGDTAAGGLLSVELNEPDDRAHVPLREGAGTACPAQHGALLQRMIRVAPEMPRAGAPERRLVTDSHAPAQYRAATVRNLDAWYEAFKVVPGQKLYLAPGDRVRVW